MNDNNGTDDDTVADLDVPFGMAYSAMVTNEEWERYDGMPYACAAIVEYLHDTSIQRPVYNLERKLSECETG